MLETARLAATLH